MSLDLHNRIQNSHSCAPMHRSVYLSIAIVYRNDSYEKETHISLDFHDFVNLFGSWYRK